VAQTIEMPITAPKVDLPGVRQGRGFSYQIDHRRLSIETSIKRERRENADGTARSVLVLRGKATSECDPQRGENGIYQCGPQEEGQQPAGGGTRSGAWGKAIGGGPRHAFGTPTNHLWRVWDRMSDQGI
jgi:hypothetical protein